MNAWIARTRCVDPQAVAQSAETRAGHDHTTDSTARTRTMLPQVVDQSATTRGALDHDVENAVPVRRLQRVENDCITLPMCHLVAHCILLRSTALTAAVPETCTPPDVVTVVLCAALTAAVPPTCTPPDVATVCEVGMWVDAAAVPET